MLTNFYLVRKHFERISTINLAEKTPNEQDPVENTKQIIGIKVYKCLACDARDILEPNLVKHHMRKHVQIPIEFNIFKRIGLAEREQCNICQKHLYKGRLKDHKNRSHPNKIQIESSDRIFRWSKGNTEVFQSVKPAIIEVYRCLQCSVLVETADLSSHCMDAKHKKKVQQKSRKTKIFRLEKTKKGIICAACKQFVPTGQFKDHIKNHKSILFFSTNGKPLLNQLNHKAEIARTTEKKLKRNLMQQSEKYFPKYQFIHKCRACQILKRKEYYVGDTGLNGINIRKHQQSHRNDTIKGNIFQLVRVKEKCFECNKYLYQQTVEKHMKRAHKWNYDMNFVKLFKCGVCDVRGISARNLEAHHNRMHGFPIASNEFETCAMKQKVECGCCGKRYMEGRTKKHHLKTCLQRSTAIETVMNEQDACLTVDDVIDECDNDATIERILLYSERLWYLRSLMSLPPSQTYLTKQMYEKMMNE